MDWRDSAACLKEDPDLFFPTGTAGAATREIELAKTICRRCPVQQPCLQWAIGTGQLAGIWGGLTEAERRNWTRRQAAAARSA